MSEASTALNRRKRFLTPREFAFLREYIGGKNERDSYLSVFPDVAPISASSLGSRIFTRIRKKIDWPALLEAAGLGEMRLLKELEGRLRAETPKPVGANEYQVMPDNPVRMRATELLATLLEKNKTSMSVKLENPEANPVYVMLCKLTEQNKEKDAQ